MTTTYGSCIFCSIVARTIPAYIVYEDSMYIAFLDIAPVNKGHTLIVPKYHCTSIFTLPQEYGVQMCSVLQHVSNGVLQGTGATGITMLQNNGSSAGQMVFHLHWHSIPRYENDGYKHWHNPTIMSEKELQESATHIKLHM